MPSRTIRPTQAPTPAPFAYTVGTADGLSPQAVTAQWDGTGAGGDFLPCVSFYSAEGVLLDRAFPTTGAVTAGDTAEVSYRPFERGGGGGGGGGALVTTDGVTTISPTTELDIDGGLTLTDLGGGHAQIKTGVTAPAYAMGGAPQIVGGNGDPLDFLTGEHSLVTVAGNKWTIQKAGLYLLGGTFVFGIAGPTTVSPFDGRQSLYLQTAVTGASGGSLAQWQFPLVMAGDKAFVVTSPIGRLIRFAVGNTIQFNFGWITDGGPFVGLNSEFYLWQVG